MVFLGDMVCYLLSSFKHFSCFLILIIFSLYPMGNPFVQDMPERMMDSLTDVFNQMQVELDQGNVLNITVWHSKAHDATSQWWLRLITRIDIRRSDHGLPKTLPEVIVDEVCELYERMEEEYGKGNGIVLSEWQAEYETFAERWWDRINQKLQRG